MLKFLELAKLLLGLLPVIIQVVQSIEAAIPASGKGSEKLALVRGALEAAYKVSGEALGAFDSIWPMLSGLVSSVVSTFNSSGVFKSSKPS